MLHSPPHLLSSTTTTTFLPHISLHPKFHFLKTTLTKQFPATLHLSHHPLLAQLSDIPTSPEDGPVELPFSLPSFISTDDDPSTIQVATSVLLTGAISVFLFRALRRRARRAKELVHFCLSHTHFKLFYYSTRVVWFQTWNHMGLGFEGNGNEFLNPPWLMVLEYALNDRFHNQVAFRKPLTEHYKLLFLA